MHFTTVVIALFGSRFICTRNNTLSLFNKNFIFYSLHISICLMSVYLFVTKHVFFPLFIKFFHLSFCLFPLFCLFVCLSYCTCLTRIVTCQTQFFVSTFFQYRCFFPESVFFFFFCKCLFSKSLCESNRQKKRGFFFSKK